MMQSPQELYKNQPLTRRSFIKTAWATLGSLALVESGMLVTAYLQPGKAEGEFGGIITAGKIDDFPPGSVTYIPAGRFYLSRLADGGFLAIHQRCTHLGCSVPWDQTQNRFVCPCHSSQFTPEGDVINPPAPQALDIFPVILEDGLVKVDTANPVRRQNYEVAQVVYA